MVLGKRGVFFTLLSILFVAVLFLIFDPSREAVLVDTGAILVDNTNAFRIQLENNYVQTLVRQRSHATFVALSNDALAQGVYLQLPEDYTEAMLKGTYSAGALPVSFQTLPQAFSNLSEAAASIGYVLSINVVNVTVFQTGAFQAIALVNISYNLSSRDGSVTFRNNLSNKEILFTLVEVPDLLYNANASDLGWTETRTFKPYFTNRWNNTVFTSFVNNLSYGLNNQSPSIFYRLEGNFAPHPYGVETFINITKIPPGNQTSVDWQYFSGLGYECTYANNSMYPSLRIAYETFADYNITNAVLFQGPPTCAAPPTWP